jgi:hypothetical protein
VGLYHSGRNKGGPADAKNKKVTTIIIILSLPNSLEVIRLKILCMKENVEPIGNKTTIREYRNGKIRVQPYYCSGPQLNNKVNRNDSQSHHEIITFL